MKVATGQWRREMVQRWVSAAVGMSMAAGLLAIVTPGAAAQERGGLALYHNERHGFSLSYPAGTFAPQSDAVGDEGRVFVSRDGQARLLAGALLNADRVNLRDYRAL